MKMSGIFLRVESENLAVADSGGLPWLSDPFFIISWRFSEIQVKIGSPRGIFDKARNHFVTCFVHKIVIKQLFNRMCFVCLFVCLFVCFFEFWKCMLAPPPIMRVGALVQRILDCPDCIPLLLSHKYVTELFPLN